jgi:hypothetical protein
MIDTLMLEKKYYELMGYENIKVVEEGGNRWLENRAKGCYSSHLPTICRSTEQATRVMLRHKINVTFCSYGVEAWHNDGGSPTTVHYHRDKSTRAYFSDDETFNVAVLKAAVELLERKHNA